MKLIGILAILVLMEGRPADPLERIRYDVSGWQSKVFLAEVKHSQSDISAAQNGAKQDLIVDMASIEKFANGKRDLLDAAQAYRDAAFLYFSASADTNNAAQIERKRLGGELDLRAQKLDSLLGKGK